MKKKVVVILFIVIKLSYSLSEKINDLIVNL